MTILSAPAPRANPGFAEAAKPTRLMARKPAVRRPGLKGITPDRYRPRERAATVYLNAATAAYHVEVGWVGDDLCYRLRQEDTGEVATVSDNARACSCRAASRFPRKACPHVRAVRSAFERVGELGPEVQPDPGDDWSTWADDETRWTIAEPAEDDEEYRPFPEAEFVPTAEADMEWLGFLAGLGDRGSYEAPEGTERWRALAFDVGLWAGRSARWADEDAANAEWHRRFDEERMADAFDPAGRIHDNERCGAC